MSKPATDLSPAERLAGFRARIDALDERLAQLLVERTGIIAEVAELKAAHWPGRNHIRPAREGQMHEAVARRFAGTAIPPIAALAIWRQIIGAATCLESPLVTVSLTHEPHHAWLSREYFGAGVGNVTETSIADALDTMQRGEANILLLPAPAGSDWWRDAALFQTHGLAIFASLPVSTQPMPHGVAPALALAPVKPESSGNDMSYVVITTKKPIAEADLLAILPGNVVAGDGTHHLFILDGYVTDDASEVTSLKRGLGDNLLSLIVLGTHPKPVSL